MCRLICRNGASRWRRLLYQALAVALLAAGSGHAQVAPGGGQVSIPESSTEKPGDTGVRAHTNIETFVPNRGADGVQGPIGSGGSGATNSGSLQAPGPKPSDNRRAQ